MLRYLIQSWALVFCLGLTWGVPAYSHNSDRVTCLISTHFGVGMACRLNNGNFYLKYTGGLSGPLKAFIRVTAVNDQGGMVSQAEALVSLGTGHRFNEIILGMAAKECSESELCSEPTSLDRRLFEGKSHLSWVIELAFVNEHGEWDSRYGQNHRLYL